MRCGDSDPKSSPALFFLGASNKGLAVVVGTFERRICALHPRLIRSSLNRSLFVIDSRLQASIAGLCPQLVPELSAHLGVVSGLGMPALG